MWVLPADSGCGLLAPVCVSALSWLPPAADGGSLQPCCPPAAADAPSPLSNENKFVSCSASLTNRSDLRSRTCVSAPSEGWGFLSQSDLIGCSEDEVWTVHTAGWTKRKVRLI